MLTIYLNATETKLCRKQLCIGFVNLNKYDLKILQWLRALYCTCIDRYDLSIANQMICSLMKHEHYFGGSSVNEKGDGWAYIFMMDSEHAAQHTVA